MQDRKAISAIVATVLIILITVVAVSIIWTVIIPIIRDNLDFSGSDGKVSVVTFAGWTVYDSISKMASVQVKRDVSDVVMNHINIIFSFDGNSFTSSVVAPELGNTRVYVFNLSGYGEPESVSVVPIFTIGEKEREGDVISKVAIREGKVEGGDVVYNIGEECTVDCAGKECGSDGCGGICGSCYSLGTGDYDFLLEHDDLTRKYLVHVPDSYDSKTSFPLVLAFHGGGGSADGGPEYFGLNEKSDEEGFIVVYPEGTGKEVFGKFFGTWNAGRCCGDSLENNIDDVGFINKMIEQLEKDFNVDEKRIFATGFSNGAQISYRLACELSDKIAAIAPGGSMGTFENCDLTRPVPVLAFGGDEDPCTPYGGGELCGGCVADFWNNIGIPIKYETYRCDGVEEHIDKWKQLNGCADEQEIIYQEKNTTCVSYMNCQEGAEIVLCTCYGGGHVWPGKDEYSAESCKTNPDGFICTAWANAIGPLIPDFNVNDMIWEFFERHPMD